MNIIVLKGRITNDLEISVTSGGTEYTKFSVAVDRPYNRDEVDFINCVAWGKTAAFISTYFEKGREILLDGELRQDRWTDKDGAKRSSYSVNVNHVEFCGGKGNSSGTRQTGNDTMPFDGGFPDSDEDLPF